MHKKQQNYYHHHTIDVAYTISPTGSAHTQYLLRKKIANVAKKWDDTKMFLYEAVIFYMYIFRNYFREYEFIS